jgi:hypothetical protein
MPGRQHARGACVGRTGDGCERMFWVCVCLDGPAHALEARHRWCRQLLCSFWSRFPSASHGSPAPRIQAAPAHWPRALAQSLTQHCLRLAELRCIRVRSNEPPLLHPEPLSCLGATRLACQLAIYRRAKGRAITGRGHTTQARTILSHIALNCSSCAWCLFVPLPCHLHGT